jgi:hypothetical protein
MHPGAANAFVTAAILHLLLQDPNGFQSAVFIAGPQFVP